jgi:hypothetical protein
MNEHKPTGTIQEDLVSESRHAPSPNPFAQSANITVTVPETVEIRLVDASALADYEVWSLLTSILSSAAIAFTVAYFQATTTTEQHLFMAVSAVFFLLMFISAAMALGKRRRLSAKARKVKFRLGDQVSDENGL